MAPWRQPRDALWMRDAKLLSAYYGHGYGADWLHPSYYAQPLIPSQFVAALQHRSRVNGNYLCAPKSFGLALICSATMFSPPQ